MDRGKGAGLGGAIGRRRRLRRGCGPGFAALDCARRDENGVGVADEFLSGSYSERRAEALDSTVHSLDEEPDPRASCHR